MSLARTAYEIATTASHPLLGLVVRHRLKNGKETSGRTGERFARTTAPRPAGPLVWMHGASIGETRLLLETARALATSRPDLSFLFTSQTTTSAALIARAMHDDPALGSIATHQFAPLDTPAIAARFVRHWAPSLAIFAEGEIWPNLLKQLRKAGTPTALINARMTEKSLRGWQRWGALGHELFGGFDLILAADRQTARGLTDITGREIAMPGNLKSALTLPVHETREEERLRQAFVGARACLVAISTHDREEEFVTDALAHIPQPTACILVPRHPERGAAVASLLESRGLSHARRSLGEQPSAETAVLLADTLGEVGLFTSIADTVYLGGGHAPGVGGHNPLEILRLGKPVATGPEVFNFADIRRELEGQAGYTTVETPRALADGFPFEPPSPELIRSLESSAYAPMNATREAILPLLPAEAPR